MPINKTKLIYIIGLGGTIAAEYAEDNEFYSRPKKNIEELISELNVDQNRFSIKYEQLYQKISHDLSITDFIKIAKKINGLLEKTEIDGVVITAGTNAIEELAYFMSLVVRSYKPIVFTGAFRPNKSPGYDGDRNLYNALSLAANEQLKDFGVLLTFNDCIVHARDAQKTNPSIVNSFSHDMILGYIQGKEIHINYKPIYRYIDESAFDLDKIHIFPKVCIIYAHIGLDGNFIDSITQNGAQGIVCAGFGKGYFPDRTKDILKKASQTGVVIVRCSRSGYGIVHRDPKIDDFIGSIAGGSLNAQKAAILLGCILTKTINTKEIQKIFDNY